MKSFSETLYDSYYQVFDADEILYQDGTSHQQLMVFRNARFGRVMTLDGIVQTTEADEFIYHEMLAHVPLFAHPDPQRLLIVGGGDGGILREACRHRGLRQITMVEIDQTVVDTCIKVLPGHSDGAFDDPRLNLVIADGAAFVRDTAEKFDVIIVDSTDPIGPGEVLFSESFYQACHRCLTPGGIVVTQNGVAFLQLDEVSTTAQRLAPVFADWHFYITNVPTYVGGVMTLAWASDDPTLRRLPTATLAARYAAAGFTTRYYTPQLHAASFALPAYILQAIGKGFDD